MCLQKEVHVFFPDWFKSNIKTFLLCHHRLQQAVTYSPAAGTHEGRAHLGHLPSLLVRWVVSVRYYLLRWLWLSYQPSQCATVVSQRFWQVLSFEVTYRPAGVVALQLPHITAFAAPVTPQGVHLDAAARTDIKPTMLPEPPQPEDDSLQAETAPAGDDFDGGVEDMEQ